MIILKKPISLIRFVANKEIFQQRGIKVKRRRAVRATVKPGSNYRVKKGFKALVGGNVHVFRRKGISSLPIIKQVVPSLAELFKDTIFNKPILTYIEWRLIQEIKSNAAREIKKIIKNS